MSGRIGVLISGRGSHLKNLIDCCARVEIDAQITGVVSNDANAPGLRYANDAAIETFTLSHRSEPQREKYDEHLIGFLQRMKIDLVCLAGFMRILSPAFVRHFPMRIMNVHPSLLPAFPGLHSQRQAIEYGAKVTGCTVHFVDEGLDSGPVILQKAIDILPEDTPDTLAARLLPVEHRTYAGAVQLFFQNRLKVEDRKVIILHGK